VIGLVRSEALRARSRRIVWVLLVTALVGTLAGVVIAMVNAERPTQAEVQAGERRWQRAVADCEAGGYYSEDDLPPGTTLEEFCGQNVRREFFVPRADLLFDDLPEIVEASAAMLSMLAVVLGASLAGADWSTGSMTTVLAWEPRRARVWLVRAGVAAVTVAVVIAVILAAFTVMLWLASSISGSAETSDGTMAAAFATSWRVVLVSAVFGTIAHAVASLGRSTIAGVGILFGYAVIFEGFVAGMVESLQPRMLIRAATVILSGNPLIDPRASSTFGPDGSFVGADPGAIWLDVPGAWVVVASYVVILGALSIVAFRARDVQ
jgi:ABC-2 type transport system permease protein